MFPRDKKVKNEKQTQMWCGISGRNFEKRKFFFFESCFYLVLLIVYIPTPVCLAGSRRWLVSCRDFFVVAACTPLSDSAHVAPSETTAGLLLLFSVGKDTAKRGGSHSDHTVG